MTQQEPTISDDIRAVRTLDVFYGMELGCSSSDLRRSGWTLLPATTDCDPMALLFGQRPLLHLVAPVGRDGRRGTGGVAAVTPELRSSLAAVLRGQECETLFAPDGLRALDATLRAATGDAATPLHEAHLRIYYTTRSGFHPYVGRWQEWIELLDEMEETDLTALGLLARYSGGVYVVRQRGAIAAYSGIRHHSPHVSEVGVRTEIETLSRNGLGRAMLARATRAILASDRLPLYRCRVAYLPGQRVAEALGYRPYAEALAYFTVSS